MSMSDFSLVLKQLESATGLADLTPDDHGAVDLLFDEDLEVTIQPDQSGSLVTVYAVVGQLGEQVEGAMLLDLLSANLFGQQTNGATFAVENTTGQIVLQHSERVSDIQFPVFVDTLGEFVDAVEHWKPRLEQMMNDADQASDPESEDSGKADWVDV